MFYAMQPLRWLYLDLNSYFASVEQQRHPHLRGKAIAVGPERIDSGTIIAASYEAKAFGIHTGMRVGEARRLCPHIIFCGGDHSHYKAYHDKIIEEVWRHIPVTHVCSIDEVACRLLDNENSPEQALALARRIKAGIRANVGECLTSSIGIAPSRLVAKIASDMQKPDGLTLIRSADLPNALLSLSLRDIPGIGAKMEARLNARGIHTMAQLLAQDPHAATASWGSVVGTRLCYALHGKDMPERPQQSRSIGHSHVIAPNIRTLETARETARRLLLKAASRLRRAECVTRHLTLHARFESRRSWHSTLKLAPTDDSFPLLEALALLWPRLAREIGAERIRVIGVTLDDIRPAIGTQLNLFDAPARPTLRIAHAMDALNEKFGRNTVTLGSVAKGRASLIGTKIAFGRIPDAAEFHE
ncbi:type VI secretion protein ImpB [Sandaracinobacter neustonicus]|uniref:DNA-directed DNA polymerase n=2 Tax=Sandaracinobacter neustonicus TaxID=1715348 RepID=A0A501XL94_9SPHN|nr:type VI secretion protein ImpB [Sandaracinobacter neustonicus]